MENSVMIAGIDFGTSNTACSVRLDNGDIHQVKLERTSSSPYIMPSYWYFTHDGNLQFGSNAKYAYIESGFEGRFMTSIKSHIDSLSLKRINVYAKSYRLEEIISLLLRHIKEIVENEFGTIDIVHAGRPACFSIDPDEDCQVEERLRKAYELAGFPTPIFVLEPTAAAYQYKQSLTRSEVALICDFGGGTLDYCLCRMTPPGSRAGDRVINTNGVKIGGDDITAALLRLFWNYFGYSTEIRDFTQTKWIPLEKSWFTQLSNWKNIWQLSRYSSRINQYIRWGCSEPDALKRLLALLEDQNYFSFMSQLEELKKTLSKRDVTRFEFHHTPIDITRDISRSELEANIRQLIDNSRETLLSTFNETDYEPSDVESVFLTGGSSQIPMFKAMVESVFGFGKLQEGDVFTSVANGLARYT